VPKSLVLVAVDPKPEAVVLEPETAVPGPKTGEVVAHYNYKDSGTQEVVKAHMC